jgi:uncharacterized protein YkwD
MMPWQFVPFLALSLVVSISEQPMVRGTQTPTHTQRCALTHVLSPPQITVNRPQADSAFAYLNRIRANPVAFSQQVGVNLRPYAARPALRWNDTLYNVALAKARDMAERGYFGHLDKSGRGINILVHEAGYTLPANWIKPKSLNYFENIYNLSGTATQPQGQQMIDVLLVDAGVNPPDHRLDFLGHGDFRAGKRDCAIAIVECATCAKQVYGVAILARHQ